MALRINDEVPDFDAETTEGTIGSFHEWIGDGWAVLFSHPKDFTPVCTHRARLHGRIEAGIRQAQLQGPGLERRSGLQPQGVVQGHRGNSGPCGELSPDRRSGPRRRQAVRHAAGGGRRDLRRTDARRTNATVRSVFVIGPDKKIKAMLTYPMSTGRNFDEVLRLVDSCPAHGRASGGHAGELETGRGRHHRPDRVG